MFRQNSSEAPFGPSNRWLPATASSLWEGFVPTFPRQRFSVTATIAPLRWLSRSLFRLANISTPPTQQPRKNEAGVGWARERGRALRLELGQGLAVAPVHFAALAHQFRYHRFGQERQALVHLGSKPLHEVSRLQVLHLHAIAHALAGIA